MSKNDEAEKILREEFGNTGLKLPGDVSFVLEENLTQCRIKLNRRKIREKNMQIDANAFEGWAVALHIALPKPGKIILDVDGVLEKIPDETNGHWGRFLYRALRFSQQYGKWFELSEQVESVVKEFKEYLGNGHFTNNLGQGEAGIKESNEDEIIVDENIVEAKFAEDGKLQEVLDGVVDVGDNKVFRQLPVGLFKIIKDEAAEKKSYKYSEETMVFTGGKSAIDLWTWNKDEDEFEVIELKTNNPMMGIITEIFFYSNYMYDFLVRADRRFILNVPKRGPKNDRGYSNIYDKNEKNSFKRVRGIVLADKFHPILGKDAVLKILNDNADVAIKYEKAYYKYGLTVFKASRNI